MNTISIVLAFAALISAIGIIWNRVQLAKGVGIRVNQFVIATVVIPVVAILALESVLSLEVTGTLLGAGIGFVANGSVNKSQ